MKTTVKLRLSEKANSKLIKKVLELSTLNTSESNEAVEILEDELDDQLLVIKFDSPKGRQIDLADDIRNSYAHFLDSYSDIVIRFET